jgi:hypothetical protein
VRRNGVLELIKESDPGMCSELPTIPWPPIALWKLARKPTRAEVFDITTCFSLSEVRMSLTILKSTTKKVYPRR